MATQVGNVVFQISADLKNIQGTLRTLEGNFQSSFGRIEGLAKNFGAGLLQGLIGGISVSAVAGFGREILSLADTLQNLHEQTRISVETLSGIKSTLEESGTSLDAFARGVFNLQKNLGNIDKDTDPAAQAIKRLGLNLDDLRNSSPDQFIKKVTDALGQVQNPIERNTILFNLLGKSAKELGPALEQLAGKFDELRNKGLTAADVKALDDVGDALTRLKNRALALGAEGAAGLLRFFGIIRDGPKLGADLAKATERFAQLTGLPKERVEGMTSRDIIRQAEIPTRFADNPLALRGARDELLNLREEFDRVNASSRQVPQAPFKGVVTSAAAAKKEISEMGSFLDGLTKQLQGLEGKQIELLFGGDVALARSLDNQLEQFKEKLRAQNLPIPKGLDQFFGLLRDQIIGANRALTDLNVSLEETVKRQEALAADFNEGVGPQFLTPQDAARLKSAQDQFRDLQQQLRIGAIDTSTPEGKETARVAAIQAEFEKTSQKIEELARTAQISNEEAADATLLAWQRANIQIRNQTDEITEFQRRAMERAFDAGADLLKDALGGQIKTWEDFGSRVKKVIDEIAAEWLTLQAKTLLFGPNFGKSSGGNIGGLLGGLGSLLGGSSIPTGFGERPAGVEGPLLPSGNFFSGGGGSSVGGGLSMLSSLFSFIGFHEGGVVGRDGTPRYVFDPPRLHQGGMIGANEVPAILEKGEVVLPKGFKGGGNGPVNIIMQNPNFVDRRSAQQTAANLGRTVKNAQRNM